MNVEVGVGVDVVAVGIVCFALLASFVVLMLFV